MSSIQINITPSSPDDSKNRNDTENKNLEGEYDDQQPSTSHVKTSYDTLLAPGKYTTVGFSPEVSSNQKNSPDQPNYAYTELSIGSDRSNDKSDNEEKLSETTRKLNVWKPYLRIVFLVILWIIFTIFLMTKSEHKKLEKTLMDIHNKENNQVKYEAILIHVTGPFLPEYYENMSDKYLNVWLEQSFDDKINSSQDYTEMISDIWRIPIAKGSDFKNVPKIEEKNILKLFGYDSSSNGKLRIQLETNIIEVFPVQIGYTTDSSHIDKHNPIIYALLVLLGLYLLIIFEIVHRTLAAMLASTMSVAILAAFDQGPTMNELASWIDVETLLLLFSMMVLVAILSETGIFDYLSVVAYRMTGGRVWPLINTLCAFTALLSAFLDNVTVSLLMTPVCIRLCEVMGLNPVPILMAMVIYSNIGGTATAVGDPPNVIIASQQQIKDAGITFTSYTLHMSIGVILVMLVVHIQLRFLYRNINDLKVPKPQDISELRHEIKIWKRTAASVSSYSKDEDAVKQTLNKRIKDLIGELEEKINSHSVCHDDYIVTLNNLQQKYPIRDKWLLIKCTVTLIFVITVFFIHSVPGLSISLGWTALLGALLLLILADNEDLEGVLARVEWSTLLFFAALFILMEALSRMGLISWIGKQTELLVLSIADENSRLAVAVILILWVSAIASAFVDNIPLTTMMVRVVISLCNNTEVNLPLPPLIWALAFGACLGGNGTLIGASANVVCAGVAEQHGYRFTFLQFFRVGFPVMIVSVLTATCYLLIAHVWIEWI